MGGGPFLVRGLLLGFDSLPAPPSGILPGQLDLSGSSAMATWGALMSILSFLCLDLDLPLVAPAPPAGGGGG